MGPTGLGDPPGPSRRGPPGTRQAWPPAGGGGGGRPCGEGGSWTPEGSPGWEGKCGTWGQGLPRPPPPAPRPRHRHACRTRDTPHATHPVSRTPAPSGDTGDSGRPGGPTACRAAPEVCGTRERTCERVNSSATVPMRSPRVRVRRATRRPDTRVPCRVTPEKRRPPDAVRRPRRSEGAELRFQRTQADPFACVDALRRAPPLSGKKSDSFPPPRPACGGRNHAGGSTSLLSGKPLGHAGCQHRVRLFSETGVSGPTPW